MTHDAILSREAAYIYRHAIGFSPIDGNLTMWRGIVQDSQGKSAEIRVEIPKDFPQVPPNITLPGTTNHPIAREQGKIITRSMNRWKADFHVFSVIREARAVLVSAPFTTLEQTSVSQEKRALQNQIQTLNAELNSKELQLSTLKSQSGSQIASEHSVDVLVEETLIDLENDSFSLEDAYDALEINDIDFAKQFVEVRKRYYLVKHNNR